jgi:hypothetical protein
VGRKRQRNDPTKRKGHVVILLLLTIFGSGTENFETLVMSSSSMMSPVPVTFLLHERSFDDVMLIHVTSHPSVGRCEDLILGIIPK